MTLDDRIAGLRQALTEKATQRDQLMTAANQAQAEWLQMQGALSLAEQLLREQTDSVGSPTDAPDATDEETGPLHTGAARALRQGR